MAAKLSKLGYSLVLGLAVAKSVGPTEKDSAGQRNRLGQLVAGITKRNRHGEVDWGGRVGKEVW